MHEHYCFVLPYLLLCVFDIFHKEKLKSQKEILDSWSSSSLAGGARAEPMGLPASPSLQCLGVPRAMLQETEKRPTQPSRIGREIARAPQGTDPGLGDPGEGS